MIQTQRPTGTGPQSVSFPTVSGQSPHSTWPEVHEWAGEAHHPSPLTPAPGPAPPGPRLTGDCWSFGSVFTDFNFCFLQDVRNMKVFWPCFQKIRQKQHRLFAMQTICVAGRGTSAMANSSSEKVSEEKRPLTVPGTGGCRRPATCRVCSETRDITPEERVPDPEYVSAASHSTPITESFINNKQSGALRRKPSYAEAASQHYFSLTNVRSRRDFRWHWQMGKPRPRVLKKKPALKSHGKLVAE